MITISPFSSEHTQAVVELILPIQREEFGLDVGIESQPDLLHIPDFYQTGKGNFWLAFDARELVGTIALKDIGNHQAALRKMFVKADHRGREHQVGKLLLETLIAWCEAQGLQAIYLGTTEKFLAAHRFYEKYGFQEVEKNSLPVRFSAMEIDSKFYRRLLE